MQVWTTAADAPAGLPVGIRLSRSASGWTQAVIVGSLTVIALMVRLAGLHASLIGDELYAYNDVHGRSLVSMLSFVGHNQESSPPLFFVLAWVTAHIGDPTETIRLPSIVFGSATVPVTYLLGRRTVGAFAGVVASGLIALTPFSIWQGAEGRPYALLMFCSAVSALMLLVALDSQQPWRWWAAYTLSVAAVIYTHYSGIFVVGAQTLWALWARPDRRRAVAVATLAAGVLFSPWLHYYHGSSLAVYNSVGIRLVPDQIVYTLLQALIGHPALHSFTALPGTIPTVLVVAVLACVAAIQVARALNRVVELRLRSRAGLIVLLSAAAPLGVLAYATFFYDILLVRNLASSVPFALIALAWLTVSTWKHHRAVAIGATTMVAVVTVIGAAKTLGPDASHAHYREAFAFINHHARPGDAVIDQSLWPLAPTYARVVPAYFSHPRSVIHAGTAEADAAWARALSGGRVFVIVSRIGWLSGYRPPPFAGADPRCAAIPAAAAPLPGCATLRLSRTYRGLQPLVVAVYSGS